MKKMLYILIILAVVGIAVAGLGFRYLTTTYHGETVRINVPAHTQAEELHEILTDGLGMDFGDKVYNILKIRKGLNTRGSYEIAKGQSALSVAMRMRGRAQTPVTVVVPNLRSADKVVEAIASNFEFDKQELELSIDSIMVSRGMVEEELPAIFLPDSYQYYWTASAPYVAQSIFKHYDTFWTDARRAQASNLHLTPVQVSTLASIVEEESAKVDERPTIARLYLNRLDKGMRLQADPTVKFALGDPTLKRILNVHLSVKSPYNTYENDGLPPGPIRVVDKRTIDAVLNAPAHRYLYMCAREDFSGYHNFATTLADHNANARKYHEALNKNNIK